MNSVLGVNTNRVSDTGRAFDVKNIGALIPGLRIGLDEVFTIINDEGSVLLEKSEE